MKVELPSVLRKEIESLRNFQIQPFQDPVADQVKDHVTLAARVRRVPVWIRLDPASYPFHPPELFLAENWSWGSISAFERQRRIGGLSTQVRWNRTLGLATLLRDLELAFGREPPTHHQPSVVRRQGNRLRERVRSAVDSLVVRLKKIRGWVRRGLVKRRLTKTTPVAQIRSDYQLLIEDKSSRIERYRQALAKLAKQGKKKQTEHEAAVHHGKLSEYQKFYEAQLQELEDLKDEARNMEAELALTEIEQEILDIRSGVDRSDHAWQREEVLQSVRDKRAKLRVSKRLAGVTQEAEDAEYLERGQQIEEVQNAKTGDAEATPVLLSHRPLPLD